MKKPGQPLARRAFLKQSALASTSLSLAFGLEEKALAQGLGNPNPAQPAPSPNQPDFPMGKIKDLTISRLICGGNLISGFAHSRDLIYVSPLLKHYFTDTKVCETLERCEEQGMNTAILRVDENTTRILKTYWEEWGGQIQWIAQAKLPAANFKQDIDVAITNGAKAVYIHGGDGDKYVEEGNVDLIGKAVEYINEQGVISGAAGHKLETIQAYEKAALPVSFYMKTINAKAYWSAGPMPRMDSVWEETPDETIEFMKTVTKPWIGYKVLGAGAIHPEEGFHFAWANGADFLCVGMFDFQVAEDALIARRILAKDLNRSRPWCS
jgi:hypothetical protein